MTASQTAAISELERIAEESGGTLRVHYTEDVPDNKWVAVTVSVSAAGIPRAAGGIPLHNREQFTVLIPETYPFKCPGIRTEHDRWADFPHVLWRHELCLYQAPAVEWDPAYGMHGFIRRLEEWLVKASTGELDPTGQPLHPPAIYPVYRYKILMRADTPTVTDENWFGFAQIKNFSDQRVDVSGWLALDDQPPDCQIAPTILLHKPMPHEFPKTMYALLIELMNRGVTVKLLMSLLRCAVLINNPGPLYFVIGTPMRGIQGSTRVQHLAVWRIEEGLSAVINATIQRPSEDDETSEIRSRAEQAVMNWALTANVTWCMVLEDRPEVTSPRDAGATSSWLKDKTVSIWGCGALGSHIAEHATRCGAKKIFLTDYNIVQPGVLSRQQYDENDIGTSKPSALKSRLKRIRPNVEIISRHADVIIDPLDSTDWTDGADILIDCTASTTILSKLELVRRKSNVRVPIVSLAVGHDAKDSIVVLAASEFSGGPADILRKAKIQLCNQDQSYEAIDEFWPQYSRKPIFQPEPGCSEPTFTGSSVDIAFHASAMINAALSDLTSIRCDQATCHIFKQPDVLTKNISFDSDIISFDPQSGYETRIAPSAWAEIQAWICTARRIKGQATETGGLLFGLRNDVSRVIWVTEVLGPPPDSEASPDLFVCGIAGTAEASREKLKRTRGSIEYIGMWHTHPSSVPIPSNTDLDAMRHLLTVVTPGQFNSLLVIIGPVSPNPIFGTYLFERKDFTDGDTRHFTRQCMISAASAPSRPLKIGLALSGGGSRAIAFHLGCMRALYDRGVLDRVQVISSVSGGSVLAAMYAYSNDSFAEFDKRVTKLLRTGLLADIAKRTFLSSETLKIAATGAISGTSAALADTARTILGMAVPPLKNVITPLRRWSSRTKAFEAVLRDKLFGQTTVNSDRRRDVDVVINACELRTGTAFRFGNIESRCWRYGKVHGNNVKLSLAVAASAAYPVLLPAIDHEFQFEDRYGQTKKHRVLLTDGGIYDNLGITCLEPGRSPAYGYQPFDLDFIVACDAGAGQFGDEQLPYFWPHRITRSFESVFRRVQSSSHGRLHDLKSSGKIKGFVLAFLGQQDVKLDWQPPDLVRREEVADYPTNFSPMSQESLDKISLRGEQLTRLLIDRHCNEI